MSFRASSLSDPDFQRLTELRDRRPDSDLTEAEVNELFDLEWQAAPNAYGQVVAVLATFPPYLDRYPALIPAFIAGLYQAWQKAFRGSKIRAEFDEFLASKAHIDDDLGLALRNHPAEFEAAVAGQFQ